MTITMMMVVADFAHLARALGSDGAIPLGGGGGGGDPKRAPGALPQVGVCSGDTVISGRRVIFMFSRADRGPPSLNKLKRLIISSAERATCADCGDEQSGLSISQSIADRMMTATDRPRTDTARRRS